VDSFYISFKYPTSSNAAESDAAALNIYDCFYYVMTEGPYLITFSILLFSHQSNYN